MHILLTGDSLIARHEGLAEPRLNATLRTLAPAVTVDNTAVSGINSGALWARLGELVLTRRRGDALVILVGTNDLATNKMVPLVQYQRNLEQIVAAVVSLYAPERIVLVTPPAVDETKAHTRTNQLSADYGVVTATVATAYGCQLVDLRTAMLADPAGIGAYQGELNDGLHFGQHGYTVLAQLLMAALKL